MRARKFWTDTRGCIESGSKTITVGAACGAGKSTLPAVAAYDLVKRGDIDAMIWTVPRLNLARGAARAMTPSGHTWRLLGVSPGDAKRFEIVESGNVENPSKGTFGYAISYQSIESDLTYHLDFMRHRRVLLVGDELQFCAKDSPYGIAFRRMADAAACRLYMSGDWDRSNGGRIECVEYEPIEEDGKPTNKFGVRLDVEYSIYDALDERAILPIDFGYGSGRIAFHRNGLPIAYDSLKDVDRSDEADAVWAAINSEYARDLLSECVKSWRAHRTSGKLPRRSVRPDPGAQLMVVCGEKSQADATYAFMTTSLEFRHDEVAIVDSRNANAGDLLAEFCDRKIPAVITIAMAYVGTDAPGLTHLCCLTHYRSPPWLNQMLGRVWRFDTDEKQPGGVMPYEDQYCAAFVPDDPRMRRAVERIKLAQQFGVFDERDGNGGGDGPGDRPILSDAQGELTLLTNKYEINPRDPCDPVNNGAPDRDRTRETLVQLGWPADRISAALRVLGGVGDVAAESPMDMRTPGERIDALRQDLCKYQRETAFKLARGATPDFKRVNAEMVRRFKAAELMSESDLKIALARYAPAIRRELLGRA